MKKIILEVENKNLDNIIEILNIHDIYNIYYDQPFQVTTTEYGYGYVEDEDSIFNLNIIIENDEDLDNTTNLLSKIYSASNTVAQINGFNAATYKGFFKRITCKKYLI